MQQKVLGRFDCFFLLRRPIPFPRILATSNCWVHLFQSIYPFEKGFAKEGSFIGPCPLEGGGGVSWSNKLFSVAWRSRSDVSYWVSHRTLADLTDVILVSDDTFRRLYWWRWKLRWWWRWRLRWRWRWRRWWRWRWRWRWKLWRCRWWIWWSIHPKSEGCWGYSTRQCFGFSAKFRDFRPF